MILVNFRLPVVDPSSRVARLLKILLRVPFFLKVLPMRRLFVIGERLPGPIMVDLLIVSLLSPAVMGSGGLLEWLLLLMEALATVGWWLLRVPFWFGGRMVTAVIWLRSLTLIFILVLLWRQIILRMCLRENLHRDVCKDHLCVRLGYKVGLCKVILLWNDS